MTPQLSTAQKDALETQHRVERDGRVRDRIKAVLLKPEGWTNQAIGQALRTHRRRLPGTYKIGRKKKNPSLKMVARKAS